MKLAERAFWAGSLPELFTRIGQSDRDTSGQTLSKLQVLEKQMQL